MEACIMRHIRGFGIPVVYAYKTENDYNILIMELLGPSLETLFQKQNKNFSLKTTCMLGIQMLDRIEYVHSRKIIHRDIKPDNFAIGTGKKAHIIYILDFGLAKKYWSNSRYSHIPFIEGKKLTGTARYASVNALSGYEQSRRDDLESIFYILIYFLKGNLPWQGLKVSNKNERYRKICEKKKNTLISDLCHGFPKELELFLEYIKQLEFTQTPDYSYLKHLLKHIIENSNQTIDFYYDWNREKPIISKDDPIYKDNYHIKYNQDDAPWLRQDPKDEKNFEEISKKIINRDNGNLDNIYSKPMFASKLSPYYKGLKNTSDDSNHNHLKTNDNSHDNKMIESNLLTNKINGFK